MSFSKISFLEFLSFISSQVIPTFSKRYLAHLREKYILDQRNLVETGYEHGFEKGVKDGIEQGIEKGIQQGIEQGIAQGSKQQKIEIAKEMKNQNYTVDEIQKITKLTKEEIEKL